MKNCEAWLEVFKRLFREPEEHVVSEQRMPSTLANNPDIDSMCRILTRPRVLNEKVSLVQEVDNIRTQSVELRGADRNVDAAPVHDFF